MEYSIRALAQLSGVSSRTLRYYDEIGLLKPAAVSDNGYRLYGTQEADRLQQILYFKAFGLSLDSIISILDHSESDIYSILHSHYQQLTLQRKNLDDLLTALADTLASYEGEKNMTNQEKFTYFKTHTLPENEALYGAEAKEIYGTEVVAQNQDMWRDMPQDVFEKLSADETQLIKLLAELLTETVTCLPSDKAEAAFAAHKNWLAVAAPFYTFAYHRTLGEMYVNDPRFTAYYDQRAGAGATILLKQLIDYYTQQQEK
ncbi:MerR family transcriptional regulator [Enterococcus sp. DIV0876]|uniref:MerR family transcriptional regulator n=1 Tax=Enterococcus sp. DIV0876 TaxID=2774633 RepID=UPI003D2FC9A0